MTTSTAPVNKADREFERDLERYALYASYAVAPRAAQPASDSGYLPEYFAPAPVVAAISILQP